MKTCPKCGTAMVIVYRNMVDPARDVFQCDGDDTRPEGDRVHRFNRYDCIENYKGATNG